MPFVPFVLAQIPNLFCETFPACLRHPPPSFHCTLYAPGEAEMANLLSIQYPFSPPSLMKES